MHKTHEQFSEFTSLTPFERYSIYYPPVIDFVSSNFFSEIRWSHSIPYQVMDHFANGGDISVRREHVEFPKVD